MELFELPIELLFEQLSYLSIESIRSFCSTSKKCANLVFNFLESQRRTVKYCILNARIDIKTDKNHFFGPLEVIDKNPIDLELNTFGAQFLRARNLRCNYRALAVCDIAFFPWSIHSVLFHGPKKVASFVAEDLLATYVLLGSPNIHIILDGVLNTASHKEEFISAFRSVLGDKAAHTKIIPINSYQKFQFNITEMSYDWYDGPTLREVFEESTKFRAPYSFKDILCPPMMIQMNYLPLTFNLRGLSNSITPMFGGSGIIVPGEFGNYYLFGPRIYPYTPPKLISSDKLSPHNYGNCYCSLTVVKNQLRPRFTNELYVGGYRFIVQVKLIAKIKDGERTLVLSANAGDQVEAVISIIKPMYTVFAEYSDTSLLPEYSPKEDPLHKNIFGKFVIRDHRDVVSVGTIKKQVDFSQTERDKFFDEETLANHESFGRNYHQDEKKERKRKKKEAAKENRRNRKN